MAGGLAGGVPARAVFHTAPRSVEIRELRTPRPAAGEVVVATLFSGISAGTERLAYRGEAPWRRRPPVKAARGARMRQSRTRGD